MTGVTARLVAGARRLHRLVRLLAPRDVRRAYGAEMTATFEAALAEAGERGATAVVRLLARELIDLAASRRAIRAEPAGPSERRGRARHWLERSAWRQAWRALARRPAYLAASVLTLGFGAGITTAVFSLVDTVLVKPLPYPDGGRLVSLYESSPAAREKTSLVAPGRLEDWNRLANSFQAISGSYSENVTDTSGEAPERLEARRVAPRFFEVYGLQPLLGRTFTQAEELPTGPPAAVISERFWMRRFGRDRVAIFHRPLSIGGVSYSIVGVMPGSFTAAATDVWLPASIHPQLLQMREARFLAGIGRLRPGVSLEAGARELAAVQAALGREFPRTDAGWSVEVESLKEVRIRDARRGLLLLFGAVGALWLIAVANVAGLTLVQMQRRGRELSIRAALGATRARLLAAVLREGVIVAVAGSALGVAAAGWLVSIAPSILDNTPRINELALDWRALVFAIASSALAVCLFSLLPALVHMRQPIARRIHDGGRGTGSRRHRLQRTLVVAQVALSVLLVGSAMLLLRSYHQLTRVDLGFDASGVLTFHVGARWDEDRTRIGQLQEQLVERLQQLPHVEAAGLTNFLPASGATLRYQVRVDGLAGPEADGTITAGTRQVTGGYLRAIRAPLLAGDRCPDPTTDAAAPGRAMVNRRFVEVHAPGQNLIGRSLELTPTAGAPLTIVGIVGDLAEDSQAARPVPYVYLCAGAGGWPDPEYVVRTSDPRALAADLRRLVRELDPDRALFGLRTLESVLDAALERPRLDAAMLGMFAAAAVTLAGVGLYSLFMLVVAERGREMAVRLAVGAAPRQLVGLVMSGAGRLLLAGIAIGLAMTASADRLLRGMLFEASAVDGLSLAAAALTLALVSALAVAGPALRAARTEPVEALRGE